MGQKINPIGFRLALNRNWSSRWYANSRNFSSMLLEDIKVRDHLKAKLAHAAVSRVIIERPAKNARITVFSARPGVVIGKKGAVIIRKVLESAIANAEHNDGADVDELKITMICVERGTFLRRFRAQSKGRGARINKPTCNILLQVGDGRQ